MKKRILSGLLVAAMLLTSLPTAAFAADDTNAETPDTGETQTILPQSEGDAEQSTVTAPSYEVSTTAELSTALTQIATRAEDEATIVLKADVAAPDFGGIAGKKVTITSSDGNCYSISMANTLTGDVTLDAVKFGGGLIYANGHTFETTGNFQGYSGSATLYGGGPKGQDVDGDTHLILRGKASYNWVYGGGCNSNVSGSTYILVDDKNTSTGNLTGGGESNNTDPTAAPVGTVGGDTHVTIQKGYSGYLVGGGRNHGDQSLKENARVYGDTYVTAGEADATELQAWIGTAMASVAGSFSSTVKNTHFLVLNGVCSYKSDDDIFHGLGTGEIYGAGMLDIVRGTTNVEVRADNAVGSRIVDVYGGHYADATTLTGEVSIRNEDNEPYAVHIIYDNVPENEYIYEPNHECDIYALGKVTPTIPVNGNVLVEVKHGNLRQVVLDSYDNDCTINGDATVRITGGRVARFEGNAAHATTGTKNTAIYDGCGTTAAPQETGYLYNFEQVTLKNGAQVSIDADPTLFPALSTVQNPFYSVNNLDITENSALTTRKSNTLIKKNVTMDHGTWHAKGFLWVYEQTKSKDSRLYFDNFFVLAQNHKSDSDPTLYTAWDSQNDELVALKSGYSGRIYGNANLNRSDVTFLCPTTVSGNWTSSNSILRLPTVATGANYPTVLIPLEIGGLSTGTTTVNTVDPTNWQTLKKPALGDNYILSKKNTDSPAQDVFVLGNADAVEDGWFLKRLNDADTSDDAYYMWQVANGVRVIFDKNGGDTEASPRIMSQEKVAGSANHFDLPTTNPTRTGYLFNGWNTKADGSGDAFTAETDVTSNITVYAQWKDSTTYSVTYKDGVDGTVFADQTTAGLHVGDTTPAFSGTPTRSGYTFTGWEPSVAATVTDNAVYTAQWAKNSSSSHHSTRYTLHYESNGGTAYKDERYSSGTKVTLDKTPTRESYTFTGWYADKALTQKITTVTMNSDKTVYAGWEATDVPDKLNGDDHFAYVIGYPDGKVHPEGNISRAETATIFFRLLKSDIRDGNLTADNDFSDVSDGQWHNKAVSTMAKLGIVKGRRADRFDPDASITRAEFAAICARFNTKPVENSGSFSDISGHWAENEIERAAAFGWISGYPDGTFHPDARITRAEAMTMINRVLCRMPQSESDLLDSMVTWPDNKPSDWHYLAVQEATNSHDFNRQGEVGESWTKLTSVPDWKRYQ